MYRPRTDLENPNRPPLDPVTVGRALHRRVLGRAEDGSYRVSGEDEPCYVVTFDPYFDCECGDAVFRERICKHQIAVLLSLGDAEATRIANRIRREARRVVKPEQRKPKRARNAREPVHVMAAPEPERMSELTARTMAAAPPAEAPEAPGDERIVLQRWWD